MAFARPSPSGVSRCHFTPHARQGERVCLHLAGHLASVKERAKVRICAEIDALTLDELYDVFESGRAQYGGEFNVEAINCVREIRKEGAETPYDGLRKLVYPQV